MPKESPKTPTLGVSSHLIKNLSSLEAPHPSFTAVKNRAPPSLGPDSRRAQAGCSRLKYASLPPTPGPASGLRLPLEMDPFGSRYRTHSIFF